MGKSNDFIASVSSVNSGKILDTPENTSTNIVILRLRTERNPNKDGQPCCIQ